MEKSDKEKEHQREAQGPLKGLRVLDLGLAGAGPIGPAFLGDWGAEVIKVEFPEEGSLFRKTPPTHNDQSFWFPIEGRHKNPWRSTCIPSKASELSKNCQGMRYHSGELPAGDDGAVGPGLRRAQKGAGRRHYDPGLGLRPGGPLSRSIGGETIASALGGLTYLTGYPNRPPTRGGYSLTGYSAGIFGAIAVLSSV